MSISQDERERAIFRSRKMYLTDQESNLATMKDIGIAEGVITVTKKMLLAGEPIAKIAYYTELSETEIIALKDQLQSESGNGDSSTGCNSNSR